MGSKFRQFRGARVTQRAATGLAGAGDDVDLLVHQAHLGHHPVDDADRRRHLASKGPFWALSSEWLGTSTVAAGLAQINALGNLSGFFFNYMIGWIKDETGSFPLAIMPIAIVAAIGTICILSIRRNQPRTVVVPT